MGNNRIFILDTTLRDGQQSPGAGMTFEDNLKFANLANKLNIDVLEAGFPAASKTDFKIVKSICELMSDKGSSMSIAGLCQLREDQFINTMEALNPSVHMNKARIHTYIAVDPNLMQASLGALANQPKKIIETLYKLISLAVGEGYEVEFSPEGYSRMQKNFDFTTDVIRAAVSAGASIINCPDSIGGASKYEGEGYFVKNMQKHANIINKEFPDQAVIWSTHCHNDFGLALDNTMQAVFEGPARQIEGCINGVGERAGNVALEQCIMYLKEFGKMVNPDNAFYTECKPIYLQKISDFIAEKMLPRQPNLPIVGENATRHTSGGHTNAILKNPLVYQPFDPLVVGKEMSLSFGPLSGSNHARFIIESYGYSCATTEKVAISKAIKDYYKDTRKDITNQELIIAYLEYRKPIKISSFVFKETANNKVLDLQGEFFDLKTGLCIPYGVRVSALNALAEAITEKMGAINIIDYQSETVQNQLTTQIKSTIIITAYENQKFVGTAEDKSDVTSGLKALINAANKAYIAKYFTT